MLLSGSSVLLDVMFKLADQISSSQLSVCGRADGRDVVVDRTLWQLLENQLVMLANW